MPALLTTENTETTEKATEDSELQIEYYEIAEHQIDMAIKLYNDGYYICSSTLANAAYSLIGGIIAEMNKLNKTQIKNIHEDIKIISPEIAKSLNFLPTSYKHFSNISCNTNHFIKADSENIIHLAIQNYLKINSVLTEPMKSFEVTLFSVPSSVDSVHSVVRNTETDINTLSGKIINCAINVHKQLGAGLLESAYQHGMAYALAKEGLKFERETPISIMIDNHKLDAGYRADFIVENKVIIEVKSVEKLAPIHDAQILNYMRLGGFELGLLMNFNETLLKNGLKRFKL